MLGLVLYVHLALPSSVNAAPSDDPHVLKLGPIRFAVPSSYLLAYYPSEHPDGSGAALAFRALLPGLRPKTSENADEFSSAAKRRNLLIAFVHYKSGHTSEDSFFNVWKKKIRADIPPEKRGPFLVYTMIADSAFLNLYVNTTDRPPQYFTCMKNRGQWTKGTTIDCEVADSLNKDQLPQGSDGRFPMVIDYTIPEAYLPELMDIDSQLRILVAGFERGAH